MNFRYLYLLVCGIIFAGIVHISIILLIPDFGSRDAWNIISGKSEMWVFKNFSKDENIAGALEDTDPFFKLGACTFDLSEAGLRFNGEKSASFWSVSVFDQGGTVMYSFNNRTAIEDRLDLVVLSPVQMIGLREAPPEEIERAIVVEVDIEKGFVLLRQFQNDESDKDAVDKFLDSVTCQQFAN
jgi:uncharacterized membrane protein